MKRVGTKPTQIHSNLIKSPRDYAPHTEKTIKKPVANWAWLWELKKRIVVKA